MEKNLKIVVEATGNNSRKTAWFTANIAWAAARGIAQHTHREVSIEGKKGVAHFGPTGSGYVKWANGETDSYFPENGIVCI